VNLELLNPLLWLQPSYAEDLAILMRCELRRLWPRVRERLLVDVQCQRLLTAHARKVAACIGGVDGDWIVASSLDAGAVGPSYPGRADTDRVLIRTRVRCAVVVGCSVVVDRAKARRRELPRGEGLVEHHVEQFGPDWSLGFQFPASAEVMLKFERDKVGDADGELGRVVEVPGFNGSRRFLVEVDDGLGGLLWFGRTCRAAGRCPSEGEGP
jgi:hypothetical protein